MSHRLSFLKEHFTEVITLSLTRGAWGCIFLLFFFFNLTSCDTYNCLLETKVQYVYGFYNSGGSIAIHDTLTITALDINTVLANRLVDASQVKLPVSYYNDADTLEFLIQGEDGEGSDTLYIEKKNIAHLDDVSCPAHMWHYITRVYSTHHLIDTVLISEPNINYDGKENLQIYFRTDQE